jgi:uncharacterized lipoprotein YajG
VKKTIDYIKQNNMKQIFLMAALALSLLTACNDGSKTNTTPKNEGPNKETVKPTTDTATGKAQASPADTSAKTKEAKEEKEENGKKDKDD